MKVQDSSKRPPGLGSGKQPYEPPRADCVRVQLEERVLGCLYSTIKVCGLTE